MKKKTSYRIRNWPAYNAALLGRGSLTLWGDEEAIRSWRYTGPTQRGAQDHYADTAIRCVLTLRVVFHLALRAAEGLARSVFALLAVDLPVPSYSTLSRRAAKIWQYGNCAGAPWQRDANLRAIRRQGRRRCKQESGYHRRSLAEAPFFRCKTLFGPLGQARAFSQQATELLAALKSDDASGHA
jgi:hypothetical protein